MDIGSLTRESLGKNVMTIHEYGKDNKQIVVLIHPSAVMWDYFEYVIPLMEDRYHLIVPALPGYDEDRRGDFTSVEETAAEEKDRAWDIDYIRKIFPQTEFRKFEDVGHGGLAALKPEVLAAEIERLIRG